MFLLCVFYVLYLNSKIKYYNVNIIILFFVHNMITKLTIRNNSTFLYLNQAMIQLLHIIPKDACFLFTYKNNMLYITFAKDDLKDSLYVTKIRKTGSGWGIYMSKSMLEFINVNPETDNVDINIENETIILKKAI